MLLDNLTSRLLLVRLSSMGAVILGVGCRKWYFDTLPFLFSSLEGESLVSEDLHPLVFLILLPISPRGNFLKGSSQILVLCLHLSLTDWAVKILDTVYFYITGPLTPMPLTSLLSIILLKPVARCDIPCWISPLGTFIIVRLP